MKTDAFVSFPCPTLEQFAHHLHEVNNAAEQHSNSYSIHFSDETICVWGWMYAHWNDAENARRAHYEAQQRRMQRSIAEKDSVKTLYMTYVKKALKDVLDERGDEHREIYMHN